MLLRLDWYNSVFACFPGYLTDFVFCVLANFGFLVFPADWFSLTLGFSDGFECFASLDDLAVF